LNIQLLAGDLYGNLELLTVFFFLLQVVFWIEAGKDVIGSENNCHQPHILISSMEKLTSICPPLKSTGKILDLWAHLGLKWKKVIIS
jgi:hypothetical protein